MRWAHWFGWALAASMAVILGFSSAFAEELAGTAQTVGSGFNAKVILDSGAAKNPELCRGDVSKRLGRLSGMHVKAQGAWKNGKDAEKVCFEATEFTVLKTSSGRDAVVGLLANVDGRYQVVDGSGKVYRLSQLSSGLKRLEGKRVILDLNILNSPASTEATYKVVTYAEMPEK